MCVVAQRLGNRTAFKNEIAYINTASAATCDVVWSLA
jgi:hypothetical protein